LHTYDGVEQTLVDIRQSLTVGWMGANDVVEYENSPPVFQLGSPDIGHKLMQARRIESNRESLELIGVRARPS
jgi:hypothetical protein